MELSHMLMKALKFVFDILGNIDFVIQYAAIMSQRYIPQFVRVKVNKIAIFCDNFTSYRAHYTIQCAKEHGIILILRERGGSRIPQPSGWG